MQQRNASSRSDRLRKDKAYLNMLSKKLPRRTDIEEDTVQETVAREADEALGFLRGREAFWDQLRIN